MRRLCTLVVVVALIMVLCAARPQPHEAYKDYGHDVCNWLDGTDENDENARPIRELMTEGHILCMRDDVAARARFVEAVTLFRSSPRALPHHYLDSALRHIRRIDVVSASYASVVAKRDLSDGVAVCREKPAEGELVRPVWSTSREGWCERPYDLDVWLAAGDPGAKLFVKGLQHCRHAEWYAAFQYFREAVVWWAATRVLEVDEGYQVAVINMDHVSLFGFHEARGKMWHDRDLASFIERCGLDPHAPLPERCRILPPRP